MQFVSQTFTGAQTDAVLFAVPPGTAASIRSVLFVAHASNSASPLMRVKLGSTTAIEHPGAPAGGGLAITDLNLRGENGDDILFDCTAPTGGSVSVMVAYSLG